MNTKTIHLLQRCRAALVWYSEHAPGNSAIDPDPNDVELIAQIDATLGEHRATIIPPPLDGTAYLPEDDAEAVRCAPLWPLAVGCAVLLGALLYVTQVPPCRSTAGPAIPAHCAD